MHQSIATISSPEFINLQPLDLNPLMSSCEIKVLYLGKNRNQSYITKEVATTMAKTLRGAPIVGYYIENKDDFADHGEQIILDSEGFRMNCLTKPYGFVAPDAKVWFQDFEDTDEFGNTETRTYLMTTGYLWTEQFPECKSVVEGSGKPHSMELDEKTMKGKWTTDNKSGIEFFIINDAIFSKLCILGEDVEPCFEGASITAPNVSKTFTKIDDDFKNTLYSMMQDLKNFALQGGLNMEDNTNVVEPVSENPATEPAPVVEPETTPATAEPAPEAGEGNEFKKNEEDDKDKKAEGEEGKKEEGKENSDENKDDNKEDEDKKKKYELLESQYKELEEKYSLLSTEHEALKVENQSLLEFKRQVEDAEKDEMIQKFTMLTDEDKADVIANKSKYSLEEIESKLSVICVRKKVNFELDNKTENHNNTEVPVTIFNLNNDMGATIPAWVQACENTKNNRK